MYLLTPPTVEPVTVSDARAALRIMLKVTS
jgi:hypothetical protein